MKPQIKHVIFDWSGTLYNDQKPCFGATREIFKQLGGVDVTFSDYKKHFTLPAIGYYRRHGIKTSFKKINDIYFKIYERYYHRGHLFEGVQETLELLHRQRIEVSIFSTVRQDILEDLANRLGLKKYFKFIHGSVCDKKKEFNIHLRQIQCHKNEVLFIGDMDHDVEAANHHGLLSGCVINGYHDAPRLLKQNPRFLWKSQKDWVPFFKSFQTSLPTKPAKDYPVSTAGALILNPKGEVFLVLTHKWKYTYGIPGGKIEKNETAEQAVKREIKEETGLSIQVKKLLLVQDCIASEEFYIPNSHFLLFNYLATTKSERVQLNNEAVSYLWIKPKDALKLKINEPTRILLEEYLRTSKKGKKKTLTRYR